MSTERIRWRNLKQNWVVFLLLVPTVLLVAVFSYTPAFEAIRHSVYNWDGAFIEEYIGLENFRQLLGDMGLWGPLLLGGLLALVGALVSGGKKQRILRIAAIVVLGIGGLMMAGDAASRLQPVNGEAAMQWADLRVVFAFLGLGVVSIILRFLLPAGKSGKRRAFAVFGAYFFPIAAMFAYLVWVRKLGDVLFWMSFRLILILIVANLFKMWPSIFTAVCIHRLKSERFQYFYRVLFVVPMIIPHMVGLLIWKYFYDPNVGVVNRLFRASGMDHVLQWLDQWVLHLGVFNDPFRPAWLGDPVLVIPALIFWGFPWVGVVGVLIYLAGLQNIGDDVYEAAEIDGITWWGKFWRIELPLIMTQVRLNLILMIIGTFQAYGFQLILLGPEGGPQNRGLTPGLYMFYQAFMRQNYGYACAIGLALFVIILLLTIVNQKFVRVEK